MAMTKYQRAMQIWMILVCAARERKTYTYGKLASILGMNGAGVLSQLLDPVMRFCNNNKYPPLTVLVVNKDTGVPGTGLSTIVAVNTDRENVFNFPWFEREPPQISDFEEA